MSRGAFDVDLVVERRSRKDTPFRLEAAFATAPGINVICGASGAGKSSLLLALIGALDPERGRIELSGRALFDSQRGIDLPTRRRRVGMVFQDAPLFPHLDALHNVAFALGGANRSGRARTLLERVGATELERRRPDELSGGQRQRIALARALAPEPAALLLDEPFSALDLAARAELGQLLCDLQAASAIPFLHVTHDLGEALRLGSRLLLLDRGRIVQIGSPTEVISHPASLPAARSVGTENLFSGVVRKHWDEAGCSEVEIDGTTVQTTLLDLAPGERVTLGLRAEDILLSLRPIHGTSARNVLAGTLREIRPHGAGVELRVTTPASFRVLVTPASVRELDLFEGKPVHLLIKATAFTRLP